MISLRPVKTGDEKLLYEIYASTREDELAGVEWDGAQKDAFLGQQFAAQHQWYSEQYDGASFDVILVDGKPAGRLYVARWAEEMRIIDIALLAEYRNRGIGTHLLRVLMEEASSAGLPVTIHVERFNPALRLYRRLGFEPVGSHGEVYLLLRWAG